MKNTVTAERLKKQERIDVFSEYHPVILFAYFAVVIVTTMLVTHPIMLVFSFVGALSYQIMLAGGRRTLRNQLLILPAFLVVALINPAFNHYGITVLFYLKTGPVTLEAIVYGIVLAGILWTSLLWFGCVNRVMTTDKFVHLFGRITPALSLVLSMVFRFVPRYKKRLQTIRNGQKCLGKDSSTLNIIGRIKSGAEELSMLLTWALENGLDTADSMRARGYGVGKRTSYTAFCFGRRDRNLAVAAVCLYAICAFGFWRGDFFAQYNPEILLGGVQGGCLSGKSVLIYIAWMLFVMLPVEVKVLQRWIEEVCI